MRPACTCLAPVVLRPAGPCSLDIYRKFTSGNLRPEGAEGLSPEPISAKIIVRRFDGRMAFVPEGQADRGQALVSVYRHVPVVLVLVLRSRPFFGWPERTFRRLLSPFLPLPSWQTRLDPPTEDENEDEDDWPAKHVQTLGWAGLLS
jgi:hypothetical protein